MPGMDGLELLVIGRQGHQPLRYVDGTYQDARGEPIDDLLDMSCYHCMSRYYTHRNDPVQFCPGCGGWERSPFETLDAFLAWAAEQSFAFLQHGHQRAYAVRVEGQWSLQLAGNADDLQRDPRISDVIPLDRAGART